MTRFFYSRLAMQNIRKNAQTYLPYIITCVCAVAMHYIVHALSLDPSAGGTVSAFLKMGTWVMGIFSVAFLFYTNSFLMKRRKREFGLLNILGLEKRHIARIIFLENLFVFITAIVLGLAFGLVFYKLAHLIMLSLLGFDFRFGFTISWEAIQYTALLFSGIFVILLISSLLQVGRARPIELIQGGSVGEREPKARWILTLLGAVALAGGYWIAVKTENPIEVMMLFFVAVILVIVGTYLLFISGGVTILKALKRNKGYYHKANHFISVSGMMYRMKQNAAGLATICILATMVLVMISSTAALYFGMEDSLLDRYRRELIFNIDDGLKDYEAANRVIDETLEGYGLSAENVMSYRILSMFGYEENREYIVSGLYNMGKRMANLYFLPQEDYNSFAGSPVSQDDGEAFIFSSAEAFGSDTLSLLGYSFRVTEGQDGFIPFNISGAYNSDPIPLYAVVVKDIGVIEEIRETYAEGLENSNAQIRYQIGFDLDADDQTQIEVGTAIATALYEAGIDCYTEVRAENRAAFLELYGGLFFLGLFLGFIFILATVLIIYYKQLSEGYDDRQRFTIMQKVGLSRREARRAINSQILTMFFLPLAAAVMHIMFAFPAIRRMLSVLNLNNVAVFIVSTALSIVVFALFYMIVYRLTARTYYRLVDTAEAS